MRCSEPGQHATVAIDPPCAPGRRAWVVRDHATLRSPKKLEAFLGCCCHRTAHYWFCRWKFGCGHMDCTLTQGTQFALERRRFCYCGHCRGCAWCFCDLCRNLGGALDYVGHTEHDPAFPRTQKGTFMMPDKALQATAAAPSVFDRAMKFDHHHCRP